MAVSLRTRINLAFLNLAIPVLTFLAAPALVLWGMAAGADRFLHLGWGLAAAYFPSGLTVTGVACVLALVLRVVRLVVEDRARDEREFYATPLQRWFS